MFNTRLLGDNWFTDDRRLDNNMLELQEQLCCMMESQETEKQTPPKEAPAAAGCSTSNNVLADLQRTFGVLKLDNNTPTLEFHGLGCPRLELPKRQRRQCQRSVGCAQKKQKTGNGQNSLSGQMQAQQEKENIWNLCMNDPAQSSMTSIISVEKLRSIGLHGDCLEHNAVLRLMDLFRSLHDLLSTDLSCSRQNSMPSDYLFDMPRKTAMPRSVNMRYQMQVLYTKMERFLSVQRRSLEANRHFDYEKYTECDKLLNGSTACLKSFKQLLNCEVRHRGGVFITQAAKHNAHRVEKLLVDLREWVKASHLCVYVFNWEMDLEHRYSSAMTQSHNALNKRAMLLAAVELQAAQPRVLSAEENFIGNRYQLENVVQCAHEHDEFLSALLAHPEIYFQPHVIALCEPPKECAATARLRTSMVEEPINWMVYGDIQEVPPSSPPKQHERRSPPIRFRS